MKSKFSVISILLAFALIITSCDMGQGGGNGSSPSSPGSSDADVSSSPDIQSTAIWAGKTANWNPTEDQSNKIQIHQLPKDVKTLNIEVEQDAVLKMFKTSTEAVGAEQTQFLVSNFTRAASDNEIDFPKIDFGDRIQRYDILVQDDGYMPESVSYNIREAGGTIDPVVGTATKNLYLYGANGTHKSTLRAKGTHCYVWVVDEYFDATADGPKVNTSTAEALAAKFDQLCGYMRDIFGTEKDVAGSDTGSMINIVVYDIGGDYEKDKLSGVYGLFYSADYNGRNLGKYFYVDSYFSHNALTKRDMYSTLAHEFQHLINYSHNGITETWYDEMLSMLAEDMLQDKIATQGTMNNRVDDFCAGYWNAGLKEWRGGDYVYFSYAMSYMFGSFLVRNYGGPALVHAIATSDKKNEASILEAIKSVEGSEKTFDELFNEFVKTVDTSKGSFNFNAKSGNWSGAAYTYNFPKIDLYNYKWKSSDGKDYTGPISFIPNARIALRPYGFTLHGIGKSDKDATKQLTFSKPVITSEKIYIVYEN